ncbi:MAG: ATP-binding protein [Nitrospirae bacterium]|nr:ATP-binding protein [Nitrospirota bacterium]
MAKKTDLIIKPKEEFAYGHIIKALAGGLYPNKFHVIREYIQNAFDAVVNWKSVSRDKNVAITVNIQKPSIVIHDNGTGMDRHTLNEYRKVGFSKKIIGESVGFRGIGKLAGISVAKKLIVISSPFGVAEKYILEFDAESMLKEIDELKKKRANIPLSELIEKHTRLMSDVEEKDKHYTMVELHEIKNDSKILFDKNKLVDYISKNAPVPFDPKFTFAGDIEDGIRKFVDDYDCIELTVDGEKIYKPFADDLKPPQFIPVPDSKNKTKYLAFCWYCEHKDKGQVKPTEISGLVYRYKNFAVGDNYLTRTTIWKTSTHLAFYFIGEIYIIDSTIVPTSQRDDFEQSTVRDGFYKDAEVISNELNVLARESSNVRRAEEYVKKGVEVISSIEADIKKRDPALKDLSVQKIAKLVNVIDNIAKRKKNIPQKDKKTKLLADQVIKEAKKLLKEVEEVSKPEKSEFDIVKNLKMETQAEQVYSTAVRTLKDFFVDEPEVLEKVLKAFQQNLLKVFSRKTK